jgi:hypothetical protein
MRRERIPRTAKLVDADTWQGPLLGANELYVTEDGRCLMKWGRFGNVEPVSARDAWLWVDENGDPDDAFDEEAMASLREEAERYPSSKWPEWYGPGEDPRQRRRPSVLVMVARGVRRGLNNIMWPIWWCEHWEIAKDKIKLVSSKAKRIERTEMEARWANFEPFDVFPPFDKSGKRAAPEEGSP